MIYLKENKINKFGSNKIYLKDKLIYQAIKDNEKPNNIVLAQINVENGGSYTTIFGTPIYESSDSYAIINDEIEVRNLEYVFQETGIYNIKYILDLSYEFICYNLFSNCANTIEFDFSNFDTSNATIMDGMFDGCSSLTSLNLSNFNTSKVDGMRNMFSDCSKLTSLDLSNFDTTNVISMSRMFYNCNSLTHIKCKQAFKDWCITNQDRISLPDAMREGGSGTWEIV